MMIMTQYNTLVNLANMESLHLQGSKILATPTTKDYTIALGDYVDDCRAGEVLREIAGNYEIEESVYYMPEE